MRYMFVACVLGLGLSLIAFGLAGSPGDRLAAFDLQRPATFLLNMDSRLQRFRSAAGELVRGLLDTSTAAFRERIQHGNPTQSPSP